MQWLQTELAKSYELKSTLIGQEFEHSGSFLKRKIHWTPDGIVWTPDLNHVARRLEDYADEHPRKVHLPVDSEAHEPSSGDNLNPADATKFRGAAARVQYLSHDRADLGLAAAIFATLPPARANRAARI